MTTPKRTQSIVSWLVLPVVLTPVPALPLGSRSPDQDFTPRVPDSNRHSFSVGIGHKYRPPGWEAACQFAYGPPRTVTSTTHPSANGNRRFLSHALTLSTGYSC